MTASMRPASRRQFRAGMLPWIAGLSLLAAASCQQTKLTPNMHYLLGSGYQAHGVWWYPEESYAYDETGLAGVTTSTADRLTADGEVFDDMALAGAHPTLQLPAVAKLTNLENGLQVTIRLNDRGTGNPARLVEITRRTAALLRMPAGGIARVRLQVLPVESHAAADALPGAPSLKLAVAPRGVVEVAELPLPPGARQGGGHRLSAPAMSPREDLPVPPPPLRLPEQVTQGPANPGRLMLRLDTFQEYRYADVQRAKMSMFGAHIIPVYEGRTHRFWVEAGPLPDVPRAEAALMQALGSGIPDARIVVE